MKCIVCFEKKCMCRFGRNQDNEISTDRLKAALNWATRLILYKNDASPNCCIGPLTQAKAFNLRKEFNLDGKL